MDLSIKILYEDEDLLVIDKPAGAIVNRSDTTAGEKTVQEWVEAHLVIPNLFRDLGSNEMLKQVQHDTNETDFYKRAGIVHRLDKETSGILLVAKTPEAFGDMQRQFRERLVKKTYIALVHGKVEPEEGEINIPVGRLPWNRKRFGILAGGREAVTKYRVLSVLSYRLSDKGQPVVSLSVPINRKPTDQNQKTDPLRQNFSEARNRKQITEYLSLLELYPQTGRTHQIRVHLKYFNHPIFADPLYAGRKTARNDRKLLSRIFLHAAKISFLHPKTKKIISFESKLPEELERFIEKLHS